MLSLIWPVADIDDIIARLSIAGTNSLSICSVMIAVMKLNTGFQCLNIGQVVRSAKTVLPLTNTNINSNLSWFIFAKYSPKSKTSICCVHVQRVIFPVKTTRMKCFSMLMLRQIHINNCVWFALEIGQCLVPFLECFLFFFFYSELFIKKRLFGKLSVRLLRDIVNQREWVLHQLKRLVSVICSLADLRGAPGLPLRPKIFSISCSVFLEILETLYVIKKPRKIITFPVFAKDTFLWFVK